MRRYNETQGSGDDWFLDRGAMINSVVYVQPYQWIAYEQFPT